MWWWQTSPWLLTPSLGPWFSPQIVGLMGGGSCTHHLSPYYMTHHTHMHTTHTHTLTHSHIQHTHTHMCTHTHTHTGLDWCDILPGVPLWANDRSCVLYPGQAGWCSGLFHHIPVPCPLCPHTGCHWYTVCGHSVPGITASREKGRLQELTLHWGGVVHAGCMYAWNVTLLLLV